MYQLLIMLCELLSSKQILQLVWNCTVLFDMPLNSFGFFLAVMKCGVLIFRREFVRVKDIETMKCDIKACRGAVI